MGQAHQKQLSKQQFLQENPFCCYCGGQAATVDERPPKIVFIKKQWPQPYRFPACDVCNQSMRKMDQIAAYWIRCCDPSAKNYDPATSAKLLRAMRNNYPEHLPQLLSRTRKRYALENYNVSPVLAPMLETGPIVGIPAQTSELLHLFLIRLFQALFYLHRNAIFPNNGIVEARLITNTTYLGRGWKELSATFGGLFPGFVRPHWTNKDLSEQFTYGWGGNEAEDLFGFLALFGSSFCALVFGFTNPVNAHGIPYAAFRNLAGARVVVDGTGSVSLLA